MAILWEGKMLRAMKFGTGQALIFWQCDESLSKQFEALVFLLVLYRGRARFWLVRSASMMEQ